jgi:low affinity Fe/Cu permease
MKIKNKRKEYSPSKVNRYLKFFDMVASKITRATGSATAFILAFSLIAIWLLSGPFFDFSDTWQLVINTGTTIITFLMVFIIQQSQNKDTVALQLKLNELIASNTKASNRLIDIEDLTDQELQVIKKFYINLSKLAEKESNLHSTHSIDEAEHNQASKNREKKKSKSRSPAV